MIGAAITIGLAVACEPMPRPAAEHATCAVAVIDTHEAIHTAVKSWCAQARPRIRFVRGYFSVGHFLAEHPSCSVSRVSVVICEVQTVSGRPDFSAVDALVKVGYRVIVYTHTENDDAVAASVQRGALTCLVKSEGRAHVINAIRAAHTGMRYIGPRLAAVMHNDAPSGRPKLAPREREVLIAWLRADSKHTVAEQLSIAPTTVKTVLQRIRAKYAALGRPATTKTALVARAIEDGIIGIDGL